MKKIPAFTLQPIPRDEEAAVLPDCKWADSAVGRRHQLGGSPLSLAEADFPVCPECKKRMTFYGQLDSINDDIMIADCGLIAVFICFSCLEVKAEIISS